MARPHDRDVPPRPSQADLREPEFDDPLPPEQGYLLACVRAIYRRRWIALTIFAAVVLYKGVQTFTATPIYEATVQLLIETGDRNVLTFEDVVQQDRTARDFPETQYRLLRSRALARQTLDALGLWERPASGEAATTASFSLRNAVIAPLRWVVQQVLPAGEEAEPAAADETMVQSATIDAFLAGVSVAPIRNSQLVDVKYRAADPRLAAADAAPPNGGRSHSPSASSVCLASARLRRSRYCVSE